MIHSQSRRNGTSRKEVWCAAVERDILRELALADSIGDDGTFARTFAVRLRKRDIPVEEAQQTGDRSIKAPRPADS